MVSSAPLPAKMMVFLLSALKRCVHLQLGRNEDLLVNGVLKVRWDRLDEPDVFSLMSQTRAGAGRHHGRNPCSRHPVRSDRGGMD